MGLMSWDNLMTSTGGLGGGLLAAGDTLSAMAASMAEARPGEQFGTVFGRALGAAQPVLRQGMTRGRAEKDRLDFERWSAERMADAGGPHEAQLFEALSRGPSGEPYLGMLPALWRAEALDKSARGQSATPTQLAKDRQTMQARQRLIENPEYMKRLMTFGDPGGLIANAMRSLVTEPDPDYERFHAWANRLNSIEDIQGAIPYHRFGRTTMGDWGDIGAEEAQYQGGGVPEDQGNGILGTVRSIWDSMTGGGKEETGSFEDRLNSYEGIETPHVPSMMTTPQPVMPTTFSGSSGDIKKETSGSSGDASPRDLNRRERDLREPDTNSPLSFFSSGGAPGYSSTSFIRPDNQPSSIPGAVRSFIEYASQPPLDPSDPTLLHHIMANKMKEGASRIGSELKDEVYSFFADPFHRRKGMMAGQ